MAVEIQNFPLALLTDGLLSFLQHRFSDPQITPPAWRWSSDDRESRLRISGAYATGNEKPGSAPAIIVERGTFTPFNRTIDNVERADANTFLNPKHIDWLNGTVNVICESIVASEASSMANYLAIEFQANRHGICSTLEFMKDLSYLDIGPEQPAKADVEPRRWQVVLRLKCAVYLGWVRRDTTTIPFNKASVVNTGDPDDWYESTTGETEVGLDRLYDANADFGTTDTNDPQFLSNDLSKNWYYITFDEGDNTIYTVTEIIDSNTLRLKRRDEYGNLVSYSAPATATGLGYKLKYNHVHFHIELPI